MTVHRKAPGASFLEAAKSKLEADIKDAEAKIQLYLDYPAGIGDHPNITEEILKAANDGAHAKDVLSFLDTRWSSTPLS